MGVPTGKKSPCPECRENGRDRAGDNLVHYREGGAHCFACGYTEGAGRQREETEDMIQFEDVRKLPCQGLMVRGISGEVAKQYGVRVECDPETGSDAAYYFPLFNEGKLSGYQRKMAREQGKRQDGDVSRVGETKGCQPFGSHLHPSGSSKMIVVTEGAEDCLAAAQMFQSKGKRYRVVSTLGTNGWKRTMEYFSGFEKVAIAFDQDPAGREAAAAFAQALRPGQAVIVRWEGPTDPNALLFKKGGEDVFLDALFKAKPYTPDGVITGEEVWRRMENFVRPECIPYPPEWAELQAKTEGMRRGEISLWTAGTSVGKTSYIRRLKQHVLTATDWRIGEVELEERAEKTWRGLMQFQLGKRWADATHAERRAAYDATYGTGRIFTLDHRSQYTRGQSLIGKLKHLHYGQGASIIFLDHITLAVSEFGEGSGLVAQDQMMGEFLEFVESTNCHLVLISHLRKSGVGGKSFEEGAVPSEDDLKGSGSLKQISFDIIGVSRNKMHEDEYERNVSQIHVMKCRETGNTGRADRLYWDSEGQALVPARDPPTEGGSEEAGDERDF